MSSTKRLGPFASAISLLALAVSLYIGLLVGRFAMADRLIALQSAPGAIAYVEALLWPLAAGVLAAAGTNWTLQFAIRYTWPPTVVDNDE